MESNKSGPREESPATQSILEMFKDCMAREERILSSKYKNNVQMLFRHSLFSTPLFWPDPIGGWEPFEKEFSKWRWPFTFSLAQKPEDNASTAEWRYQKLRELLRAEKDKELCWLIVARWMKQEKVREPEEFVPKQMLDRLLRRYMKSKRISPSDLAYWAAVIAWKPYFVRLQSDLRNVSEEQQAALEKMGYDPGAIKCATSRRSLESAIIAWISERRHMQSRTFWNAYSRTNRKRPQTA